MSELADLQTRRAKLMAEARQMREARLRSAGRKLSTEEFDRKMQENADALREVNRRMGEYKEKA